LRTGACSIGRRLDSKSRMSREVHVRICERVRVRLPRATRPVLGFSDERDAQRVLAVLPKRFARFGLALHPTNTKLVRFQAPCDGDAKVTLDFLGFTHYWGQSRRSCWVIQRKTARDRLRRALKHVAHWCRHHRHRRIAEQYQALSRKLQGHYADSGISGNSRALRAFRFHAERLWIKWLGRRSQRGRLGWEHAQRVLARFSLPRPRIVVRLIVERNCQPRSRMR
jgi:RNA-directed DNA polymerase